MRKQFLECGKIVSTHALAGEMRVQPWCDDPELFQCRGFEGSSFRGCTRVAALDVGLWTQLFSLNQPALLAAVDRLLDNLQSYRDALASGNRAALAEKLAHSAARKREMDLPGPDLLA